jgi:type II secretory pathway pseudopilin PulG
MLSKRNNPKAFTLIEVVVSMTLIFLIGAASWRAVSTLGPTSQATQNRNSAQNLITYSQEEVLRTAQNQFNTLQRCDFTATNTCGFEDISTQFAGFTRILSVTPEGGSTEFKEAHVTVEWNEFGVSKSLDSVLLIARPPEPLPGNVIGEVEDSLTSKPLPGVRITLTGTPNNASTYSTSGLDTNYTFADPGTGHFILPPGTYTLTATLNGYEDYTYPLSITVSSNLPTVVPVFKMIPKPADASITAHLVDASGNLVNMSYPGSDIKLYENGASPSGVSRTYFNSLGAQFNVSFADPTVTKRCFTLATLSAYRSKLAGPFTCNGFSLQANGWSSAQASLDEKNLNCAENWSGDSISDTSGVDPICVTPGQPITENIILTAVPTAIVTALVQDQNGTPINATSVNPMLVRVNWHDGTLYSQQTFTSSSDGQGHYVVTVPAEQDLFPDGDNVRMWAKTGVNVQQCCNTSVLIQMQSNTQSVGPLPPNQTTTLTINTTVSQQQCGNANGNVTDASTNNPLSSVNVTLTSANQKTDSSGDYAFTCSSPTLGYSLPAGTDTIAASLNSYYTFDSSERYYNTAISRNDRINIIQNQNNIVPAVALWPIGYGTLSGTVYDSSTKLPIAGAQVFLVSGSGASPPATTSDMNGQYVFNSVQETWPPPALLDSPNYIQTVRNDYVHVNDSSLYNPYISATFIVNAGANSTQDIYLDPKSNLP